VTGTNGQTLRHDGSTWIANSVLFNNGTNVGIGTTSPGFALDVIGRSRIRSGGGTAGIWFSNAANTADRAFIGMLSDNYVGFYGNGGGAWGMAMNVINGNIGMGTTDPRTKLDVRGNLSINDDNNMGLQSHLTVRQTTNPISGTNIVLANLAADLRQSQSGVNNWGSGIKFTVGNSNDYTGTAAIVAERTGSWSQGKLHFAVNNSGSAGKTTIPILMTIDGPSGNLGIGITAPSAQLHTTGSIRFQGAGTPGAGKVLTSDASGNATWETASSVTDVCDEIIAADLQTSFPLSQTPATTSKVKMFINGVRISNTAYSWSGITLTYVPANNGTYQLKAGDRIQFDYFR